jgi:hypothetical protein
MANYPQKLWVQYFVFVGHKTIAMILAERMLCISTKKGN